MVVSVVWLVVLVVGILMQKAKRFELSTETQ